MISINIARDFSPTPGGRYAKEGDFSGEEFRKKLLLPKFKEAEALKENIEINLDGCYGFATSFLEEAFGGLARELKSKDFIGKMTIISNDETYLKELIDKYIKNAL